MLVKITPEAEARVAAAYQLKVRQQNEARVVYDKAIHDAVLAFDREYDAALRVT